MASKQTWIEQTNILSTEVQRIEAEIAEIRQEVVKDPEKFGVRIVVWRENNEGYGPHYSRSNICAVHRDAPPCPYADGSVVETTETKYGDDVERHAVEEYMDTWCVSMWEGGMYYA